MGAHRLHLGGQAGWAHDEGHGAGVFHTFDRLDIGHRPRKIHVFLPRVVPPGARLPVVYLHDGDTAFWRGGIAHDTWDVAGTISRLGRRLSPVIAVAVHPLDRNHEYTHVDWAAGRASWGGIPTYGHWLAESLKPWIDAHYPTNPDRAVTSVAGSSHGGLASFWIATRHPTRFGLAGCLSPSFFSGLDSLDDGAPGVAGPLPLRDAALVAEVAPILADPALRPRLWVCWGTRRDGGDHNRLVEALAGERSIEMIALLRDQFGYRVQRVGPGVAPDPGADLWWAVDPGAGHTESAWRRRFGWALGAFYGDGAVVE